MRNKVSRIAGLACAVVLAFGVTILPSQADGSVVMTPTSGLKPLGEYYEVTGENINVLISNCIPGSDQKVELSVQRPYTYHYQGMTTGETSEGFNDYNAKPIHYPISRVPVGVWDVVTTCANAETTDSIRIINRHGALIIDGEGEAVTVSSAKITDDDGYIYNAVAAPPSHSAAASGEKVDVVLTATDAKGKVTEFGTYQTDGQGQFTAENVVLPKDEVGTYTLEAKFKWGEEGEEIEFILSETYEGKPGEDPVTPPTSDVTPPPTIDVTTPPTSDVTPPKDDDSKPKPTTPGKLPKTGV